MCGELHACADRGILGLGILCLFLRGLELLLEDSEGVGEVIALCRELLDELFLAVEFFLLTAMSVGGEEGREGELTASCWSFAPRVLRMEATFATRALCWAARASLSSFARLSCSVSWSTERDMAGRARAAAFWQRP